MGATDKLVETTVSAVGRTLEAYGLPGVEQHGVRECGTEQVRALVAVPGAVVAVDYEGRVSGSTALVMSAIAVRRIAAAMMGGDPADVADDGSGPDELSMSAIAEVGNQALGAASTSLGEMLEVPVEIGTPTVTVLAEDEDATGLQLLDTPRAITVGLVVCGEPVHLVLLMPTAVFVRVESALDRGAGEAAPVVAPSVPGADADLTSTLSAARVRLTADVGGARVLLGDLVGMPRGAPIVLDHDLHAPVLLRANGTPFAEGELLVQHGRWAFRIHALLDAREPRAATVAAAPAF